MEGARKCLFPCTPCHLENNPDNGLPPRTRPRTQQTRVVQKNENQNLKETLWYSPGLSRRSSLALSLLSISDQYPCIPRGSPEPPYDIRYPRTCLRRAQTVAARRLKHSRTSRPLSESVAEEAALHCRVIKGDSQQQAQSRGVGRAGASEEGIKKEPGSHGHRARPKVTYLLDVTRHRKQLHPSDNFVDRAWDTKRRKKTTTSSNKVVQGDPQRPRYQLRRSGLASMTKTSTKMLEFMIAITRVDVLSKGRTTSAML